MKNTRKAHRDETGFTLVELMIAVVVSLIISAAVYASYKVQQKTATAQGQVTEIQQNLRAGFYLTARDLRMAGYDPGRSGLFGITTATAGRIVFTTDTDEDETVDADETIAFGFDPAIDANNDGIPDAAGTASPLERDPGGGYQPIAEDIERIQFLYTLDNGTTPPAPTAAELDKIVSIKVSILARAGQDDYEYTDTKTYTLGDGTVVAATNDNFRRRLLTSTVQCRNSGI